MNNINNLISEELSKMSQLFHHQRGRVISEQPAKDVTDLKTYPACVQKLSGVKITQTAAEVFANTTTGPFLNYRFYNNGRYSGPKVGSYSCSGTDILIDGKKLTTTSTTYPLCITNKGWGEPTTSKGGQTSINGGKTADGTDFTGYYFYNNGKVLTPKKVVQSYKCSADNKIISIFATPVKTANSGLSTELTACVKQYNKTDPQPSKTPGFVYVKGSNNSTVFFSKDYKVIYRSAGGEDTQGQWSCEGNVLKITTTDGDSFINGKWTGVPAGKPDEKTTDTASVVDAKVKTGKTQKLSTLTQDVQKSIGGRPTGKISSQELDSILQRLEGNDVSGEVSQSLPTDASGKPDLDKILASLSQ